MPKKTKSPKRQGRLIRSLKDLTKKELTRLEAESKKQLKLIEPQREAIRRSGRITAKDLATRITV